MEFLAIVIATIGSFVAGYKYNLLKKSVVKIREDLQRKVTSKSPPLGPTDPSIFIDPLDEVTRIKMAHDEAIRKLNE